MNGYVWTLVNDMNGYLLLVQDMINLLYYEYWTDKQKYLYVYDMNGIEYGLKEMNEMDYGLKEIEMKCDQWSWYCDRRLIMSWCVVNQSTEQCVFCPF